MPELPEIETLKNSLNQVLINRTLINIDLRRIKIRYDLNIHLLKELKNVKIISLKRRAKYLIINFDINYSLIIHLGMSGKFLISPNIKEISKHDHVIFYLNNEEKLTFNDARRFGMVYLFPSDNLEQEKIFIKLGIEPLSKYFNTDYLLAKFKGRKIPIKTAIMNNDIVVGVGNIYASEALFFANINPYKIAAQLTMQELERLIIAIKKVLINAIAAKGTTLRDFVDGNNVAGKYKYQLYVYGNENNPCKICSHTIIKIRQSGRSTYYCINCQK